MNNKQLFFSAFSFLLFSVGIISSSSAQLSAWIPDELTVNQVRIVISRETTEAELADIIEALAEDDIKLKIKQENRSSSGELKSVSGTLKFPDGTKSEFKCKKMGKVVITRKRPDDGPVNVKVKAGRNIVEWIR